MWFDQRLFAAVCLLLAQFSDAKPLRPHQKRFRAKATTILYGREANISVASELDSTTAVTSTMVSTPRPKFKTLSTASISIPDSVLTGSPHGMDSPATTAMGLTLVPIDDRTTSPPSRSTKTTAAPKDLTTTFETPTTAVTTDGRVPTSTGTVAASPSSHTLATTKSASTGAEPESTKVPNKTGTSESSATAPESSGITPTTSKTTLLRTTTASSLQPSLPPFPNSTIIEPVTSAPVGTGKSSSLLTTNEMTSATGTSTSTIPAEGSLTTTEGVVSSTSEPPSLPETPSATLPLGNIGASSTDVPSTNTLATTSQSSIIVSSTLTLSHTAESTTQAPAAPTTAARPTGNPNSEVPTAFTSGLPSGTSTVATGIYQANLDSAKQYNAIFSKLTPQSACSPKQAACVGSALATCNDNGSFSLAACPGEQKCFALPLSNFNGIMVGCSNVDEAESILGGNRSGSNGGKTTMPTTTVTDSLVTTTNLNTPTIPVETGPASLSDPSSVESTTRTVGHITRTTTVIVDDGPSSTSATEPSFPTAPSDAETTVTTTTAEGAQQPITTDKPYAQPQSTTTRPLNFFTITESIKQPDAHGTGSITTTSAPMYDPDGLPAANPTSLVLIPIQDDPPKASEAAVTTSASRVSMSITSNGFDIDRTTQTINGTPIVSIYITKTIVQKERVTVTLIVDKDFI